MERGVWASKPQILGRKCLPWFSEAALPQICNSLSSDPCAGKVA